MLSLLFLSTSLVDSMMLLRDVDGKLFVLLPAPASFLCTSVAATGKWVLSLDCSKAWILVAFPTVYHFGHVNKYIPRCSLLKAGRERFGEEHCADRIVQVDTPVGLKLAV